MQHSPGVVLRENAVTEDHLQSAYNNSLINKNEMHAQEPVMEKKELSRPDSQQKKICTTADDTI
jgi:hypothetical protein